ncbi:uncharacterized protein ARMOST_12143 [Armillaria ostoyae]|uniref:Uncharacterized protein n=1 Tax=Armillaria ostoyae TaxID=47428 RepID=A0A284RJ59_ARMOS|nr:uncharacterized protein ARMOST_12143 [Armillaria ostoyae]
MHRSSLQTPHRET